MKNLYRRYNQKKRDKKSHFTKKEKLNMLLAMLPIAMSILASISIAYVTNSFQLKISKNNTFIQKELNLLKKDELELNKLNSYPAFTFDLKEEKKNIIYTLVKTKGEMNNINFSVFEVISGNGTFNDEPLSINQSLHFSQEDFLEERQASYPLKFNAEETKTKMNYLFDEKNVKAYIDFLFIDRFYRVSYMNFEHEFKDEYYQVGHNGIARSIDSPHKNIPDYIGGYSTWGGFSGKHDDTLDSDWLANKLVEIIKYHSYTNK